MNNELIKTAKQLIEQSNSYKLGHISYSVINGDIEVISVDCVSFGSNKLISLFDNIDTYSCYLDYRKDTEKVVLRIH